MQTNPSAIVESLRAVDLFLTEHFEQLDAVVHSGSYRNSVQALAEFATHGPIK